MTTLLCYIRALQRPARRSQWLLGALLCYAFALLAKELAVIVPILLFLWEILAREGSPRIKIALRLLPFALLTIFYLAIRKSIIGPFPVITMPLPWTTELLTIPSILVFYARKLFLPDGISSGYDNYYVTDVTWTQFRLPLTLLLVTFACAAIAALRGWMTRIEIFCWLAGLISLLPTLNFSAFPWRELFHDRYIYLPSLFFALAIASILARMLSAGPLWRKFSLVTVTALALLLAVESEAQVWFYRDDFTLALHSASMAPNNLPIISDVVQHLLAQGKFQEAEPWLRREASLGPGWWYPYYELGRIALRNGELDQAQALVEQSIANGGYPPHVHGVLAQILEKRGQCLKAVQEWSLSGRPMPDGSPCATLPDRKERPESHRKSSK